MYIIYIYKHIYNIYKAYVMLQATRIKEFTESESRER